MKNIKTYKSFNENTVSNTGDKELYELSLEVDDILMEITDEGYPYVHKASVVRDKIIINITNSYDIDDFEDETKFKITPLILTTLERLSEYVKSMGYEITICLTEHDFLNDKHVDFDGGWRLKSVVDEFNKPIKYNEPINILNREVFYITINITK